MDLHMVKYLLPYKLFLMPKKLARNPSQKISLKNSLKPRKIIKEFIKKSSESSNSSKFLEQLMKKVLLWLTEVPKQLHHSLNLSLISSFLSIHFPIGLNLQNKISLHRDSIFQLILHPDACKEQLDQNTLNLIYEIKPLIHSLINKNLPSKQFFALLISTELFQYFHLISTDLLIFAIKNFLIEVESVIDTNSLPTLYSLMISRDDPYLPEYDHKKFTLVLDLDLTLGCYSDNNFTVRPGVCKFIEETSQVFELVLFTAAEQSYTDWVMEKVDPSHKILLRLYRQHMIESIKDLKVLGRDLSKVIVIDDNKQNLQNQIQNLIQVIPWTGEKCDKEFEKLANILVKFEGEQHNCVYELVSHINLKKQ